MDIKKGTKYAILMLIIESPDGFEWQERYLCSYHNEEDEITFDWLKQVHPDIRKFGVLFDSAYGKRIKLKDSVAWFSQKPIRYTAAREIMELALLPVLERQKPVRFT